MSTNDATTPPGAPAPTPCDDRPHPIEPSLREFVESLADLVWSTRVDGFNDYYNARFLGYLGKSLDEAIGWCWAEVIHPDDLGPSRRLWEESMRAGVPFEVEHRIRRRDGRYRWHRSRAMPIRDDEGRIARWFGTCTDIDDIRRADEAAGTIAEQYRAVYDQAAVGIAEVDLSGRFLRANARYAEIVGYPEAELIGRRFQDITHPDDLPGNAARFARIGDGPPSYTIEKRYIRRDGAIVWIHAAVSRICDASGRPDRVVAVVEDINERVRLEAELRRNEQRHRSLVEATAAIAWTTAASGEADSDQPGWSAFTGQTFQEYRGWGWLDAIHPDDRAETIDVWTRSIRTRRPCEVEYRLRRADGEYRHMSVRAVPIAGPDGEVVEWFGVHTDITERKRAEQSLRDADRRKDEFLATLAHELRNPLAPLRNGLQVMKVARDDIEAVEQSRAMMERQLSQLVRLVDDLLDLSRIGQGRIELRTRRVELARVVEQAVETSRPLIEAGGHGLTIDLPPEPIRLDADPDRLAQVFANLLNNAARYTPPGGRIRLTARRSGDEAAVAVRDDGIGIPPEMLAHVFEMFAQVDRPHERSQGGLGIGLSLVKGLVERHGGTVEARSDGPGRGSEFTVRLPVAAPAPSTSTAPADAPAATGRRILVVDDNRDAADSLAMMLRILGNETQAAHDGLEALDAAPAFRPDVILLDIGMPRLDGYDAARRIRREPWGLDVVLVALTGWAQEDDRRRSREAGFDFHLVKPVEPAALLEMLARPRLAPA